MKRFALAAALGLSLSGGVQATAIELVPAAAPAAPTGSMVVPAVAVAPPGRFVTLVQASELPEPEVFAMMLVGLILIGYRAGRDSSSETFK